MITYMRSNDAWLGFPYDVFNFTMIQNYVAAALDVAIGRYFHMVGSMHVYEEHYDKAQTLVNNSAYIEPLRLESPRLTYPMPQIVRTQFNEMAYRATKDLELIPSILREPWANYINVLGARRDEYMRRMVQSPYTELVNR